MSNTIAVLVGLLIIKSLGGSVPENLRTPILVLIFSTVLIDMIRIFLRLQK